MAKRPPKPESKREHKRRLAILEKLPLHDVEVIVSECQHIEGHFRMFGSLNSLELIEALGIFLADPDRSIRKKIEQEQNGKRLERSGSTQCVGEKILRGKENFTGKERRSGCDSGVEGSPSSSLHPRR